MAGTTHPPKLRAAFEKLKLKLSSLGFTGMIAVRTHLRLVINTCKTYWKWVADSGMMRIRTLLTGVTIQKPRSRVKF